MKGLDKVQVQLLNETTGEVIKEVNPLTDAECVTYSNATPTVKAHGGIPAGTTFENVSIQKMLDDILYEYTKPTISLSANPAGGVREIGTSLTNIVFTATVKKMSENIKSVEFFNGNNSIGSVASPKAGGGAETFTYAGPLVANASIKARVKDTRDGAVDSNAISYTFVYPIYIGALPSDAATPTSDQIKALEKRVVTKASQKYTYTITDKRMCIACPPGMTIKTILDPNGFDSTAAFTKKTIAVTGLDGTAQNYTVYVGDPATQSNYTMSFNI